MKRRIISGLLVLNLLVSTLPMSVMCFLDADFFGKISLAATAEEEPQENESFKFTLFIPSESSSKNLINSRLFSFTGSNTSNYHDVFHDIIIPPPDPC